MRKAFLATLLAGAIWFSACVVPAWVNTVESDAEVLVPIAASLVGVIDPALIPLVGLITTALSALEKTLDTFKASPTATNLQAVQAAVAAVNANVAQLESAAQIKDPATDAKVTAIVALIAQATAEIVALAPAPTTNASVLLPPRAHGGTYFKKQFNKLVAGDARFKPLK